MGVDDWITGVELVGVGVVVGVIGVELDVVGRGEDVVIRVEEVEGLGVKEEVEATEEGLLLAIELVDGGLEVLVGDDGGEEVVGTPVFVLEVELVDIVNCLLNTSFLGCLDVAMSVKEHLKGVQPAAHLSGSGRGASYLKPCLGLNHAQQQQRLDWSCLGGECRSVAVSCLGKSVGRAVGGLLLRAQWWADWRCLAAGCPGAV